MATSNPSSDNETSRARWAAELRAALMTLSSAERGVLHLSYSTTHLTQVEIATQMDIPLANVRANAASGLQRLGAALIARAI